MKEKQREKIRKIIGIVAAFAMIMSIFLPAVIAISTL
jgi:hypothetical protein